MRASSLIITALVGLINVSVAHASTVTFVTPAGSTSGGSPVDTSATFTTSPGSVSVTLTNLQANPTDVSQALGAVRFMFSTNESTGTLMSSSTTPITVASNGTFTLGSTVSTGWSVMPELGGGLVLGVPVSSMAIIGPPGVGGTYSNANATIAGNGSNNPFSDLSATFTITSATLTAASTITVMEFVFGATEFSRNLVVGVPVPSNVPLPAALPLFATGLGALGLLAWRRKRKVTAVD